MDDAAKTSAERVRVWNENWARIAVGDTVERVVSLFGAPHQRVDVREGKQQHHRFTREPRAALVLVFLHPEQARSFVGFVFSLDDALLEKRAWTQAE